MDYIQQAIDKAREERQGNIGKAREDVSTVDGAPLGAGNNAVQGMPETINYTATRQVDLSDKQLRENRIVSAFDSDPDAEIFRQLRTQVLQKLRANEWQTVAVTSPNENAGKTLTAVNLAIALSKEVNQTVLLVDLDLRKPSVLDALGISTEKGLVDHLKGEASVAELMVNPGFERLVILPGKADPTYSSEILASPAMKRLMEDLTSRYKSRIIIFDMPALQVTDDALTFIPYVDSALLVVEDGMTAPDDIERCMELLQGTNFLGSVLNKAQ